MATDNPAGSRETDARQCNLRAIFLQDLSFESPHMPDILFSREQPELRFSVESSHRPRDGGLYEVVLELTVQGTSGDKTLLLIELKQGGLFEVSGYSPEDTATLLKTKAPEALYPYARALITTLVSQGGFPPLLLRPLNFATLHAEAQRRQKPD